MREIFDQPAGTRVVRDGGAELAPNGSDDQQNGQHHRDRFHHADDRGNVRADTVVKQHRGQSYERQVDPRGDELCKPHGSDALFRRMLSAEVSGGLEPLHNDEKPEEHAQIVEVDIRRDRRQDG